MTGGALAGKREQSATSTQGLAADSIEGWMTDIAGDRGELIDRLIKTCSGGNDEWAYNNLTMLAIYVGMEPRRRPWDRDQYTEQVRQHLARFTQLGLWEHILVRGLRDELGSFWTKHADVGTHDQRVAELRETTEHIRDNPVDYVGVSQFGNSVEEVVANAEAMLAHMAESQLFSPTTADDAAVRWSMTEQWRRLTDRYLSDSTIRTWWDEHLRKNKR